MSKQNIALITGVTGQDGSYLAELLLDKGYDVHGVIRRSSVDYRERIAHLEGRPHFHLHYADLGDSMSIVGVVADVRPTEIYNLAAQSHVQVSFDSPEFTADVDAVGVLRIIEAVRKVGLANSCKIYQASTSELYGKVEEVPQNENTPFHPFSPYAAASSIYLISIIGHCLSRFIYTGLMRWFSPSRLLTFGGVMSALLSLTVVLSAGTGWICITSLVLISSFMSLMFPTIYGIALGGIMRGKHPGDSKIGASGLIMSILGGALLTPLQGMVSDHTNIYTSYAVPAFCFVVVTAYAVYAHRCKATL